ncbi:GbsR/MarR family transcriptional regulator [Paenibacillus sp. P36]|uniref:GbsR/MarR family transcriptional regulator n=1 Tax=Paenibacillus sp. P36 TaxID=3342538 RepID=UPI0038B3FBAE
MDQLQNISSDKEVIIQKARKRVIESIGKNMDLYGVTQSIGHLYGMLFFQNKPMTLDEMGEAMEMSKTSMSTGVRTLVDLKMVNKVWEKGTRKDLYEVEMDWFQTFSDYFSLKWRKALEINLSSLNKSKNELKQLKQLYPDDAVLQAILQTDLDKIDEAIRYYQWLDRLIDSFETGDIFNLIPKDSPDDHNN